MAESSFTESLSTLRAKIAWQRGYGRDWTTLGDTEKAEIEDILVSGLRSFYWPKNGHVWSFMRPMKQLVTVADQWQYPQEGDYADIEGDLTFQTTSTSYCKIPVVGENQIREFRQTVTGQTGVPRYAATRPIAKDPSKSSRFEIILWPTPDAVYTLDFKMVVNPNILTDASPFPYGGPIHSETILQACLAAAEGDLDDNLGVHAAKFQELLASSVAFDAQFNRPNTLGDNLDRSDRTGTLRDRTSVLASYAGVTY